MFSNYDWGAAEESAIDTAKRAARTPFAKSVGIEAVQEGGEQLGQNVTAKTTFDPNRPATEGVLQATAGGALGGGIIHGGVRLGRKLTTPTMPQTDIEGVRKGAAGTYLPQVEEEQSGQPTQAAQATKSIPVADYLRGLKEQEMMATEQVQFTENAPQKQQNKSNLVQDTELFIQELRDKAEPFRSLELTDDNWKSEFGESKIVQTPIGQVKLGEHQYDKLIHNNRERYFGLIKPTLENPLLVSKTKDGSKIFVKVFKENGMTYFASVTVTIDGLDIVVSNHPKRVGNLKNTIESGELLYRSTALDKSAYLPPKQPAHNAGGRDRPNGTTNINDEKNDIQALRVTPSSGESATQKSQAFTQNAVPVEMERITDQPSVAVQDIATTLSKDFNVPIRTGRTGHGKNVPGLYKTMTEVIRLRKGEEAELGVISHEVAHHIDKTTQLTKSMPAALISELGALDYDPQKGRPSEGFDSE